MSDYVTLRTQKKLLGDGTYEYIFSSSTHTPFLTNCHLCGIGCIHDSFLHAHSRTSLHMNRMQPGYIPNANDFREKMVPVDHIPPENFLTITSNFDRKTIGSDVIKEIYIDGELFFYCCVCNVGSKRNFIMHHLESHPHFYNFLEHVKPQIYQILSKFSHQNPRSIMKIIEDIKLNDEIHFGREQGISAAVTTHQVIEMAKDKRIGGGEESLLMGVDFSRRNDEEDIPMNELGAKPQNFENLEPPPPPSCCWPTE